MSESILKSVKSDLGISDSETAFDSDVLMNINAVFSVLYQIGVGDKAVSISSENEDITWSDAFADDQDLIDMIRTYTYMRSRIIFDPPSSSFVLDALTKQIQEYEWRIKEQAEGGFDEPDDL